MTEVAFHFNVGQTLPYICRLLRKAVNAGARVLVIGPPPLLHRLDHDLWTFAPQEFVAHCLVGAPAEQRTASPVLLTHDLALPALADWPAQVLLNLLHEVPQGYERFPRVIEVVSHDEADRAAARQRWKQYSAAGLTLTRHDLAAQSA